MRIEAREVFDSKGNPIWEFHLDETINGRAFRFSDHWPIRHEGPLESFGHMFRLQWKHISASIKRKREEVESEEV